MNVPTKVIFRGRSINWVGAWLVEGGVMHLFTWFLMVRVGGLVMGTVGDCSNQMYTQGPKCKIGLVGG